MYSDVVRILETGPVEQQTEISKVCCLKIQDYNNREKLISVLANSGYYVSCECVKGKSAQEPDSVYVTILEHTGGKRP